MKLHQDRETFGDLLSDVSRRTGIRSDIIEKDYYLTLLLWELSERQGFRHTLRVVPPCIKQ